MDLDKVFGMADAVVGNLNFEEIIKMTREIMYHQVCYFSETNKGIIYNGKYSKVNIEQATRIQQKLSACLDLYNQVITNKREFDEDYLREKGI